MYKYGCAFACVFPHEEIVYKTKIQSKKMTTVLGLAGSLRPIIKGANTNRTFHPKMEQQVEEKHPIGDDDDCVAITDTPPPQTVFRKGFKPSQSLSGYPLTVGTDTGSASSSGAITLKKSARSRLLREIQSSAARKLASDIEEKRIKDPYVNRPPVVHCHH